MKKILTLSFVLFYSGTILAQKVRIIGETHFERMPQTMVLYHTVDGERTSDTILLKKNGKFKLWAKVDKPEFAILSATFKTDDEKRPERQMTRFYIEPGKIKINIDKDLSEAMIKGGKLQKDYATLTDILKPFNSQQSTLTKKYRELMKAESKDKDALAKIDKEYSELLDKRDELGYRKFLLDHLDSRIALYALQRLTGYDLDPNKIEPLFNKLSPAVKETESGQAFAKRIEAAKKTAIGAMAMEFTQNDTLGKPVSLSDFKGKYLLIDFWASWCGPCRAENPNVVKAYNKYKDKNFTVLGVSLDQPDAKQAWMDAIHHDELYWTQVSDLKFWDNEVAKMYGIRAIPQNFLLDPSGKIIAKNIRGEELEKKLNEVIPD